MAPVLIVKWKVSHPLRTGMGMKVLKTGTEERRWNLLSRRRALRIQEENASCLPVPREAGSPVSERVH